jgi:transposase
LARQVALFPAAEQADLVVVGNPLFRRWRRAGVWAQVLTALQARADAVALIGWQVSVDSAIARAHQHAAGARTRPDEQAEPRGAVLAANRPITLWAGRGAG